MRRAEWQAQQVGSSQVELQHLQAAFASKTIGARLSGTPRVKLATEIKQCLANSIRQASAQGERLVQVEHLLSSLHRELARAALQTS